MSSLKKLALRGTIWTFVGYGASMVLRLGGNLILTRILLPEFFGLMGLIQVFINGLVLFSDIGIDPSIIQNKRGDDPDFFNTAWTIQIIRGFLLWLVCCLITWPLAILYENQQLLWLLPIVGSSTIVMGLNSTAIATLNRRLDISKITILEFGAQGVSLIIMIVCAWLTRSIWALVIGNLIAALARMLFSHRLIPGMRNRLTWEPNYAKEIFSFGKWIFISTAMTFLASQADRLILGKLISLEMLGVYFIAFTLADMPRQVIKRISIKVIFPAVSQQADLPREVLRAKIISKLRFILAGLAIAVSLLVSFGDLVILLLYDDNYIEASWMLPILALGLWFFLLFQTMQPILLAIGKPLYAAQSNLIRFVTVAIGLPLGFKYMGLLGGLLVIGFSDFPLYLSIQYGLWREKLNCTMEDIMATAFFLALIALFVTARIMLGFGHPLQHLSFT